jgi:Xaa-Pro aminopeptidase
MYAAAMRAAKPGKKEYEIVAEIARVVMSRGCTYSFPPICSVHGETLHNPFYRKHARQGRHDDSGLRRRDASRNASDITRRCRWAVPSPRSSARSTKPCCARRRAPSRAIKPGVPYKEVHLGAAKSFVTDLTAMGLMKGNPTKRWRPARMPSSSRTDSAT